MFETKLKTFLLLLSCVCFSIESREITDCDYFDTVDLTDSKRHPNGSYEYEGVLIPVEQTGNYSYKIFFEGTLTSVREHTRGCVCKLKPCIRYCCHRHRLDLDDEGKCARELGNPKVNITLMPEGTQIEANLLDHFVVQQGIQIHCNESHHLVSFTTNENWVLFEDGTLYRSDDCRFLSKRDYCIQPEELASRGHNFKLMPGNCIWDEDTLHVVSICAFTLLLTILIYIFVLRLRHINDKYYLCYLMCLLLSVLVYIVTKCETFPFGVSCYLMAYLGYFCNISVYLWLAVMAFDIWEKLVHHTYEVVENSSKSRFWIYSLFVWGTASVLLFITILADFLLDDSKYDSSWKVGYLYYDCYLKMCDWSGVVYFLAPASLIVACNSTLVIITAKRICVENGRNLKELRQFGRHKGLKQTIGFMFYLRFFTFAMLDWTIELFAAIYYVSGDLPEFMFYFILYFLLGECIFIFIATVLRRDVIQLLKHWCSRAKVGLQNSAKDKVKASLPLESTDV